MTSSLICVMIGSSTAWGAGFGVPVPNLVSQFGEIHQHVGVRWFESGTESLSEITTGLLRPGPALPLLSPGSDSHRFLPRMGMEMERDVWAAMLNFLYTVMSVVLNHTCN